MARSRKSDNKADDSAIPQIDLDEYIRTRDMVVTGLATLQSAVQDLSRAYLTHTNTVIGKAPSSSLVPLTLANPFGGDIFRARPAISVPNADKGESKKRKSPFHDKNAPKRPVTPYFLYMQTARLQIAAELAPNYTAKEIANEGTARWNEMKPEEREMWNYRYAINLARYKEKVKAYKAGMPIPEISDEQAKELYDELQKSGIVHMPPPEDLAHAIDHMDMDTSAADDDKPSTTSDEIAESIREPSPPPLLPTRIYRSSKRRRHTAGTRSATLQQANEKSTPPPPPPDEQLSLPPIPAFEERVSRSSKKDRKKNSRKSEIKDLEAEVVDIKSPTSFAEPTFVAAAVKHDTPTGGKSKRSKRERKSEGAEYYY